MTALPAVSSPLGVFTAYTTSSPVTILLQERVLAVGGVTSFDVKDTNGNVLVSAKATKGSDERVISDANGQLVVTFKVHRVPLRYVAEDAAGNEVFSLHRESFSTTPKIETKFKNAAAGGGGGGSDKSFIYHLGAHEAREITCDGQVVAKVLPRRVSGEDPTLSEQYAVAVAPNVDAALIACICLASDEIEYNRGEEGYAAQ